MSGIDFLAALEQRGIRVPVVLITADPTSETAIRAMNLGAFDYVVKPLDTGDLVDELTPLIAKALEFAQPMKEKVRLPGEAAAKDHSGPQLLGNSKPMQEVYKLIGRVAKSETPVLILGETGTGKELVARAIHSISPRKNGPFVAMNCTALNEDLLDDELFGHEPRSFSGAGEKLRKGRFEYANEGTLFLDEVGDMPPTLQAKLLRVLENQEIVRIGSNEPIKVDVRVLSATHRDLEKAATEDSFRQDLLFRLNGMMIHLPPLRARGEDDLQLLVEHCLRRAAEKIERPVPSIHHGAWIKLRGYEWPGNIRELQNVIGRASIVCTGSRITATDLELGSTTPVAADTGQENVRTNILRAVELAIESGQSNLLAFLTETLERELLRRTLSECGGNQVQTAKRLGISRNGLRAKMRAYDLG